MPANENYTTGEKLDCARKNKGEILDDWSEKTGISISSISKVLNGRQECSKQMAHILLNSIGLTGLPIHEYERESYKYELRIWYKVIDQRNLVEAQKYWQRLSVMKYLPIDVELFTTFKLVECRYLLTIDNFDEAKEIIDIMEPKEQEMDYEQLYYYYRNYGTWHIICEDFEKALEFYLKAQKLPKRDFENLVSLYYAISFCYGKLGLISLAIAFLEKIRKHSADHHNTYLDFYIDYSLAANYIHIKNFNSAKILLDKCKDVAERDGNKKYMGDYLLAMGLFYCKSKNWLIALRYFDETLNYLEINDSNYLIAVYQKGYCHFSVDNFDGCLEQVQFGREVMDKITYESHDSLISFTFLERCATLKKSGVMKYVEDVYLPLCYAQKRYYHVVELCELLAEYYTAKDVRYKFKAVRYKSMAFDALSIMLEGGDLE